MNKPIGIEAAKSGSKRLNLTKAGLKMSSGPKWVVRILALTSFCSAVFIHRDTASPELRLVWEFAGFACFFVMGVCFAALLPIWTKD